MSLFKTLRARFALWLTILVTATMILKVGWARLLIVVIAAAVTAYLLRPRTRTPAANNGSETRGSAVEVGEQTPS